MHVLQEDKDMLPNIIITDKQGVHTYDLISAVFERERRIFLDRPIDDTAATEMILQLGYLDKLSDADITLFINSPGGAVSDGLAIVDAMRRSRSDISTYGSIDGIGDTFLRDKGKAVCYAALRGHDTPASRRYQRSGF